MIRGDISRSKTVGSSLRALSIMIGRPPGLGCVLRVICPNIIQLEYIPLMLCIVTLQRKAAVLGWSLQPFLRFLVYESLGCGRYDVDPNGSPADFNVYVCTVSHFVRLGTQVTHTYSGALSASACNQPIIFRLNGAVIVSNTCELNRCQIAVMRCTRCHISLMTSDKDADFFQYGERWTPECKVECFSNIAFVFVSANVRPVA